MICRFWVLFFASRGIGCLAVLHLLVLALQASEPVSLGTMDGFWRNTAVLDRTLPEGRLMWKIPAWMTETDFPYTKKPFDRELPFADACTVVRLLGGWMKPGEDPYRDNDPDDLAGRDGKGEVFYRWDLLKARLDPYVTQGYELTLVLDNIPHCFPERGLADSGKHYGQVAPPRDMAEWKAFVRAMCEEIQRLYGPEIGKRLRFRMGTEMQDDRRFRGTFDQYCQVYDHAAAAVKEVFPEAEFGPFNRSMPQGNFETFHGLISGNVGLLKLAEHCAHGTNTATGEVGSPFDFAPRSFYYFSTMGKDGKLGNIDPDQRLPEFQRMWEAIEAVSPKYKGISREVHEYGAHLDTEEGIYGLDTGARGAAQNLDTLIGMKEIGTDRIWHWKVFERIAPDKILVMSQAWLYCVMERMRGGQLYSLSVTAASAAGNRSRAWISVKDAEAILMVAHWNPDRTLHQADKLTLKIPAAIMPTDWTPAGMLALTEANSVFDILRDDLKAADMLSEKHLAHRGEPATTIAAGGNYDAMAADRKAGARFVADNWPKYLGIMQESLKLKPFSGESSSEESGLRLSFEAACPSVTVVVLRVD